MLKKQKTLRVPRGTARRLRREAAKAIFPPGKGFSTYWNGGKPDMKSLELALVERNRRDEE